MDQHISGKTVSINGKIHIVNGVLSGKTGDVYESYLPAVNSQLDYNMPTPRNVSENITYQEAVRLPYEFYGLNIINGDIPVEMFAKSNEFTFTQHFVDDYGDNHK